MVEPLHTIPVTRCSPAGGHAHGTRTVPEETPVALVYDGSTHAVMMATPADLEDFALGFSIAEGKINGREEIAELSVIEQANGIELRMWLTPAAGRRVVDRRRAILGPTGCGLCGVESLDAALPVLPSVGAGRVFTSENVAQALSALATAQSMNREARALHAAGFWRPDGQEIVVREDVGRHNALDKLIGAVTRAGFDPTCGMVVLTSRLSVEMVQKSATLGVPFVVAVSVPTALALRTAEACGISVIGVAREDGFEIFTHLHRISDPKSESGCTSREVQRHAAV